MAKQFKGTIRVIFIISVSLNFLVIAFFAAKRFFYSHEHYFYAHGYLHQHKKPNTRWITFLASKADSCEIIFAGTSLTQGFQLQGAFNNSHIKNLGFSGNMTLHLTRQISTYIGRKPAKLFLEGGINDIRYGLRVDTIYHHFIKICSIVKNSSPNTKLYVQSVLPTNNSALNSTISAYNQKITSYCLLNHITYINLYPAFLKNGLIDGSLTTDGIHLTEPGYFVWKKQLDKYVAE